MPARAPILLTDEEADLVIALMHQCFEEHAANYSDTKYPPAIYEDLRRAFGCASQVSDDNIRTAILWKFGHLRKNRIPRHHEQLISSLQRQWPALSSNLTGPTVEVFTNLKNAIGGRDRFITTAFFVHLLRPSEVPIVDQHNFRAMNYYCRTVRPGWRVKSKPRSYEDVATLSTFMSDVRSRWAARDASNVPDERKLDRFLMMYGKALKARKAPRTQPNPPGTARPKNATSMIQLYGSVCRSVALNDILKRTISFDTD